MVTWWPSLRTDLKNADAEWVDRRSSSIRAWSPAASRTIFRPSTARSSRNSRKAATRAGTAAPRRRYSGHDDGMPGIERGGEQEDGIEQEPGNDAQQADLMGTQPGAPGSDRQERDVRGDLGEAPPVAAEG